MNDNIGTTAGTDEKPAGHGNVTHRRIDNLLYLSGQLPVANYAPAYVGQVGTDVTVAQATEAARLIGGLLLETTEEILGTLDNVSHVVKALGFVNSAPGFSEQSEVMHGFSEVMIETLGARGEHARSAIGVAGLPKNAAVEVELIVAIKG